jgi:hypothetical protein
MAALDNPDPLGPPRPPMVLEQMVLALAEKVEALAQQVSELEKSVYSTVDPWGH